MDAGLVVDARGPAAAVARPPLRAPRSARGQSGAEGAARPFVRGAGRQQPAIRFRRSLGRCGSVVRLDPLCAGGGPPAVRRRRSRVAGQRPRPAAGRRPFRQHGGTGFSDRGPLGRPSDRDQGGGLRLHREPGRRPTRTDSVRPRGLLADAADIRSKHGRYSARGVGDRPRRQGDGNRRCDRTRDQNARRRRHRGRGGACWCS